MDRGGPGRVFSVPHSGERDVTRITRFLGVVLAALIGVGGLAMAAPEAPKRNEPAKIEAKPAAGPKAPTVPMASIDPNHVPLGADGIHDPANPGLSYLQEPVEALRDLPPDRVGNHVNWVKALDGGFIEPRKGMRPDMVMNAINMDVVMDRTASMPNVVFPHRQHTQWLSCGNCHTAIFLPKRDGNPVTMYAILNGQYCGVCHGRVAFPLSDCFRCHNRPRDPRSLGR